MIDVHLLRVFSLGNDEKDTNMIQTMNAACANKTMISNERMFVERFCDQYDKVYVGILLILTPFKKAAWKQLYYMIGLKATYRNH